MSKHFLEHTWKNKINMHTYYLHSVAKSTEKINNFIDSNLINKED